MKSNRPSMQLPQVGQQQFTDSLSKELSLHKDTQRGITIGPRMYQPHHQSSRQMVSSPNRTISSRTKSMEVLFVVLCCIVMFSLGEASNITFPPLFNAALQANVTLDPPDATCGTNTLQTTYCESFEDHTSIDACRTARCNLNCQLQHRNQLTYPIITFEKIDEKSRSNSRDCISLVKDNLPGTNYYFSGITGPAGNQSCHLDLIKDWVVNLILFQVWSTTITVWIKPNNTLPGTLMVLADEDQVLALRLYINSQSQLGVDTGQQVVTRADWKLPQLQWTFLAVTVENSSVSVFFNGSLIGNAVYGVSMKPPRAKQGRIGGSFTGSDYFVGYLRNLKMFVGSISNREIQEVYTGVLPELRVLSECRCPAGYASLHKRDTNLCVANPGSGRPSDSKYRISPKAFPVQYVNDGRNDTKWLSSIQQEMAALTVTLNQTYEIYRVAVVMYSPPPNYLRIEKRHGNSPWRTWHHFSVDCQARGYRTQVQQPDDVICQPITTGGQDEYPYTGAQLVFDIQNRLKKRGVGSFGDFTKVSAVRIYLEGHLQTIADDRHKYHSIQEIMVQSLCECNGHGVDCDRSRDPYQCICSAQSYTRGRQCTECLRGAYRIAGRPVSHALYCQGCDCLTEGTIGASTNCQMDGGQCDCKANVEGRRCDQCQQGYYNLTGANNKGCDPCGCNPSGVKGGSLSCNNQTGQCSCKANVIGRMCDLCKDGFYDLRQRNQDGCKPCDCNEAGSDPASSTCNKNTGQCMCKKYVDGQNCGRCKDGYYGLSKNRADGCQPCGCDMKGSVNASCDNDSGQCYCRPNVIGRTCDRCADGYFAIDDNDFRRNGCTHRCDCNVTGSVGSLVKTCDKIGGQCLCKDNVGGRACDRCKLATYGFGLSIAKGCLACDCDIRGVVTSANICERNTGQCNCKKNVEGLKCDKCTVGTYNLRESDPEGCEPCHCYKYGVLPNEHCNRDTGACACKPGAGRPEITGYTCYPYINPRAIDPPGVKPTRGPESGGTRVTISGGYFGAVVSGQASVTIDQQNKLPCTIIRELSNDTTIVCVSESLRRTNLRTLINKTLTGSVSLEDNDVTASNMTFDFTYTEDPNIMTVRPLTTIQTGGLRMTVTGTTLDAVEEPRLLVHMMSFGNLTTFESKCKAFPTKLICPTPNLRVPKNDSKTEEQQAEPPNQNSNNIRTKRSAEAEHEDDALNNEDTQFYFGFAFDDADLYNNITEDMPDIGQLWVFRDPEFDSFTEREHIKVYQPYWPFSHKNLELRGKRLNLAASESDYRVTIGKSYCDEIILTTNRLICIPPKRQPDAESKQLEKKGAPHVQVDVGNVELFIGFMKYEHTFWENLPFRWGVIGGLIALLLLLLLIILCVCCIRRQRRKAEDRAKHPHLYMRTVKPNANNYISAYNTVSSHISTDTYMVAATDLLMLLPEDLRQKVTTCLIEPSRMEIGKVIGQGHYGRVYLGRLADKRNEKTIDVAIKTLREYHISPQNVVDFLEEGTIMKDFDHEHVLNMYGVVIDENNRAYVLLPYMANGDLKAYVADDNNMLRVGELIDFGLQVADGMCYLSERKFIHRDLAARNCMVDSSGVVKIADFGLSCDLFETDYYRSGEEKRPLPVKWMSLESLEYKLYSSKSDVWSFGVLLWELLTRGCTPYPDVDSYDIKNYLISGNRMDKPDFAPQDIYQLMTECWELSPENRPTFREIAVRLTRFLEENNASTTHRRHTARYVRPRSLHDQQMTMTLDLLP